MKSRFNRIFSRIFWLEGVTEWEVVRNLNDRTPSRLRERAPRRVLVVAAVTVAVAFCSLCFLPDNKLRSYLEFAFLVASITTYLLLRKSVRVIADAPTELLDERQVAVRDAAHTLAYRLLSTASVGLLMLGVLADSEASPLTGGQLVLLVYAYCGLAACLPSMVLAWGLPSEDSLPSAEREGA